MYLSLSGSDLSTSEQKLKCTLKLLLVAERRHRLKAVRWQRKVEQGKRMKADLPDSSHQPTVKQLWSPRLFVQNCHQPRSGKCYQKTKEIAVNLWVIEHTYIPLCLHLYLLWKPPDPFFFYGAHLLYQYTANGIPSSPCPPSPTGLNWCKRLPPHFLSGGKVTHFCGLFAVSCPTFSQLQVLMPSHCSRSPA